MESLNYITTELKKFILEFSRTRVRYEYDKESDTHFIEVVPNDVYHLDIDYIKWESEMFDRFVELYPEENICFISDDALVGLDKVDFEICGKDFVSAYSTVNSQITVLLENHINVNSVINNDILFNINICTNLSHSILLETPQGLFQLNRAGENNPNLSISLAA